MRTFRRPSVADFRFLFALILAAAAYGQCLPGDDPTNAVQQIGSGIVAVNTTGFVCTGPIAPCQYDSDPFDMWWYYLPTATGHVAASVCPGSTAAPGGGVPGDTFLVMWSDGGGFPGAPLCCSDSSPNCGVVEAEFCCPVTAGIGYFVQLGNWGPSTPLVGTAAFAEGLYCGGCLAPANDECAAAIPVAEGCGGPYTNVCATTAFPVGGCGLMANDVWFTFTATQNCTAFISTCGADFDTVIAVFDACNGNELVCNDDAPKKTWPSCWGSLDSYVELPIVVGGTYYVSVGGFAGATGSFPLNIRTEFTYVIEEVSPGVVQGRLHNGPPNATALIVYHLEPDPPTYDISGECPHVGEGWFYGIDATLWDLWTAWTSYVAFTPPWYAQLDACGAATVGPGPWVGPPLLDAVAIAVVGNAQSGNPTPPIRYL